MQLELILCIAWQSEACVQRLHVLPSVAQYCATHRANVMQHFTVCNNGYYISFNQIHRTELDAHGRTLPAVIYPNGSKFWWRCNLRHREDRDEHGHVLPAKICANGKKKLGTIMA